MLCLAALQKPHEPAPQAIARATAVHRAIDDPDIDASTDDRLKRTDKPAIIGFIDIPLIKRQLVGRAPLIRKPIGKLGLHIDRNTLRRSRRVLSRLPTP